MADEPKKPDEATEEESAPTVEDILRDPRVAAVAVKNADAFDDARLFAGEITLVVKREKIFEICQAFKADGYDYLVDVCGSDYSSYPKYEGARFCVNYHIYSFDKNERIRLKTFAGDGESVRSVSDVWKTANWHERETWDMYGIPFEGHPNLERILMWEGFNGHPLRKDFPVRGIDTGARIYPEVFAEGEGPMKGSSGKDVGDVNIWDGDALPIGRSPAGALPPKETEDSEDNDEGGADA